MADTSQLIAPPEPRAVGRWGRGVWWFLVFGPAVASFAPIFLLFWWTGESRSVSSVLRQQTRSTREVLFGCRYREPASELKRRACTQLETDVLALGSSRVLQLRRPAFKDGVRFYNAGLGVNNLWQFRPVLAMIPEGREPKVLLISLDHYYFNRHWAEFRTTALMQLESTLDWGWTKAWRDLRRGKFDLGHLLHPPDTGADLLGIVARTFYAGFRSDGSYRSGPTLDDEKITEPPDFAEDLERIQNGNRRYEPALEVAPEALEELRAFLEEASRRNIHVCAFLPPYANTIWHRMTRDLWPRYQYLDALPGEVAEVCAAQDQSFFDFSALEYVGIDDDRQALDGFHGSEKAYTRMLVEMARRDPELARFVDLERCRAALKNPHSLRRVFDDGIKPGF